jgi:hypothetical protein
MASTLVLTCLVQRPVSGSRNILFREAMRLSLIFSRMSSSSRYSLTSHSQPYPHQESARGKGAQERSDDTCCAKVVGCATGSGKGDSGLCIAGGATVACTQ